MKYRPCDQIGNDLWVAAQKTEEELGYPCPLQLDLGEALVQEVERLDRRPYRLVDTIDHVLNAQYLTIVEWKGYRRALLKIIGRRKGAARDERIQRDRAADFPRGQKP